MNDSNQTVDRLFGGLEPPELPPDLRPRVLGPAAAALAAPNRWQRIWHNPRLRLAWAASIAMLVVAHIAITPGVGARDGTSDAPVVAHARNVNGELAEIIDLPRLRTDLHPLAGGLVAAQVFEADSGAASPPVTQEQESTS
jgi:hypothetical protein